MANAADRRLFWGAAGAVVVADVATKLVAETLLARHLPVPGIGDYVQLRLVYNQCAAFGLCLGSYSRWIFFGLALVALVVLRSMVLEREPEEDPARVATQAEPERGALVVHQAELHVVADHRHRQVPGEQRLGDELGDDIRDDDCSPGAPEQATVSAVCHLPLSPFSGYRAGRAAGRPAGRSPCPRRTARTCRTSPAWRTGGAAPRSRARSSGPPATRTETPSPAPSRRCPGRPCGTSSSRDRRRTPGGWR